MRIRKFAWAFAGSVAFGMPALADQNDWVGLYKGLDALDGSIDYMSISPTGPDMFEIRIMPSVISLCDTGQGWILADGRLTEDGQLHRHNGQVICEGNDPVSVDDRYLDRDPQTGIISYGATDDRRPLIYHRISSN